MKKLLALLALTGAVTAQAQETCKSVFGAKLKVTNPICFTNEDCRQEIAEIQRCLPEDYVDSLSAEYTVKKAIAKLNKQIAENTASDKETKRLASLPGVRIGMTAEQVIKSTSWGRPHSVNRTTTAQGVREQWSYGYPNYLYFTNGILTSFQN